MRHVEPAACFRSRIQAYYTNKEKDPVFDEEGICDACRANEQKENIDWQKREAELIQLLDKYRSKDGSYDCPVPGSGGKDSSFQTHILKYKYGMNPLTVTWPPILYTDYGYENWKNWIDIGGFDNVSFRRNGRVMKLLTRLAIENLLHPFQTFMLGQKNLGPKLAAKFGIPLVFYGENEAEYGNPIADNSTSLRDKSFHTFNNIDELFLGGVSVKELREKYKVGISDLLAFLPAPAAELKKLIYRYITWGIIYDGRHKRFIIMPRSTLASKQGHFVHKAPIVNTTALTIKSMTCTIIQLS